MNVKLIKSEDRNGKCFQGELLVGIYRFPIINGIRYPNHDQKMAAGVNKTIAKYEEANELASEAWENQVFDEVVDKDDSFRKEVTYNSKPSYKAIGIAKKNETQSFMSGR